MLIKNKKIKIILLAAIIVSICFAVFFYFNTSPALAQYGEETVENINVPQIELIMSIIRIINYVLGFLALIAIILVIYAGFLWMTAGGSADKVEKAKKILINALIGLAIIILSFAIVTYVFNVLEDKLPNGNGNGNGGNGGNGGILPQNIFKISSIVTSCGNPPNYEQDVYLCSAVVINFNHHVESDDIQESINDNTLKIEECDNDSCSSTSVPDFYPTVYNTQSIPTGQGSEWTVSGRAVIFSHEDLFKSNQKYRLIIPKTLKDRTGLEIDPNDGCGTGLNIIPGCVSAGTEYRWTFETGTTLDDIAPEITSTYAPDQSSANYPNRAVNLKPILWVKFSEAILPTSVNENNIKIIKVTGVNFNDPDNTGTPQGFINPADYEVEINPLGNGFEIYDLILDAFEWYEIQVSDILDLCNNSMSETKTWRFQTSDIGPGVKKIYPSNDYQKACPDTRVYIKFNTSMYNPESASCQVFPSGAGGYVLEGRALPALADRYLQVIDDYPGQPADPNNYCQKYEFLPITSQLDDDIYYSIGINTNLIINQNLDHLNYGDIPPAYSPSQGDWHFKVKPFGQCENEQDDEDYLKVNNYWPGNCNNACQNTSIGAEFNMALNQDTLNDNNISVFKCNQSGCEWDSLSNKIDFNISYLEESDNDLYQLDIEPTSNLEADTYYRVVLLDNILNISDQSLSNLNFSTIGEEENDSFSWIFGTKNEICELDGVEVKPAEITLNRIGASRTYRAYALGRALDNCNGAPLNSSNYNWTWSSSDIEVATILIDVDEPNNRATAVSNGQTDIMASTSGLSDSVILRVDTTTNNQACDNQPDGPEQCNQPQDSLCTDPDFPLCSPLICKCVSEIPVVNILNYKPTGQQECTNLVVSALFDRLMKQNSLKENIEMWQGDDSLDINLRFNKIKSSEQECLNKDGCTQVKIYPKDVLEKGKEYKITVNGGQDGVKSNQGGILPVSKNWTFTTLAEAEICLINKVEIIPSRYTFTQVDQTQDFNALTKSKDGQEITSVANAYEWTWHWNKVDNNEIINITNSSSDIESVTANNVNGQATLVATASTTLDIINHTQGKKYNGYAQITNFLCLNPWPANGQPYIDTSGYANFSLFYCRDRGGGGVEDDLPALEYPPNIDPNPANDILRDYLFLRDDDSTDAIGLRIFSNSEHLSPQIWYEVKEFSGSPSNLQVDGYQAIQDGRSIYVSATTLADSNLFTNIYLISYNENASIETIEVYNRLLDNWTFNINMTDVRVCESEAIYCTQDSECTNNDCNADKSKLIRDTKRITDLGTIKKYLNDYKAQNTYYPKLEAGSYVQGYSTSKWPSWTQTLGPALGKSLPTDPINKFNNCPIGYEPETCWNETTKDSKCPDGTYVYQYQTDNPSQTYHLYGNMEYIEYDWDKSGLNYGWEKQDVCNDFSLSN